MAKKKTKKKALPGYGTPKKRRTLKDAARKLSKSGVYSNKALKAKGKKAIAYAKKNPYEVALTAAMMHPGVRLGAGLAKAGKAIAKGAKALGKKKISGAPIRRALGTKVKGGGKVYKSRAQAEVAAGGTKRMKGATIDKTKGGWRVNPSRANILKSPKTFIAGGLTVAEITRRKNKAAKVKKDEKGSITKKKTKKKTTTKKRKTYTSVESNYTRKRDDRGTRVTTSTPRANQRRTIKKKAKTKRKSTSSGIPGFVEMVNKQRRIRSRRY